MKFMEINDGFILPVYLDEQTVLKDLEENGFIDESNLTEYYQQIAEDMMSKGLLKKAKKSGKIGYTANQGENNG